jgi:hypothetical protein
MMFSLDTEFAKRASTPSQEFSMIELLPEPATNVISVKVSGKLQHEDFNKLLQLTDAAVAREGKARLLIVFGDFHGWDLQSLWDDIRLHTTHSDGIERIAYVVAGAWEKGAVNLAKPFTRSAVRCFDATEMDAARTWLAEP